MKRHIHKSSLLISMLIFSLVIIAGSSCDPNPSTRAKSSAKVTPPENTPAETPETTISDYISHGKIDQAKTLLSQQSDPSVTARFTPLIQQYEAIQNYRKEQKAAAYKKQFDELEKIRQNKGQTDVFDVNDIDEIMLTAVRVQEFADEQQKEALLKDPLVQRAVEQARSDADQNRQQGKWLDAYAHGYYWLSALYPDDKTYKDEAEKLSDLSQVELSLQDSGCNETAAQRYKGIQPEMLLRAVEMLHTHYVSEIDFQEMMEKGLDRLELVGEVLEKTNEKLGWTATKEDVAKWQKGLDAIRDQFSGQDDNAKLKPEIIAKAMEDVIGLNAISLHLPDEVIVAHFSEGAFSELDPFTTLVWPWNGPDFDKSMTQEFTGIGVEISKETGVLKVASLLPDTPAYKSGLDAGDEIIEVDGEPTKDMTIYCAVSKITGPKGTTVHLKIRRPSTGDVRDVAIVRDKIVVQPVRGWIRNSDGQWDYIIDPDNRIGYVRLTAFTESSGPDIDEALRKMEKQKGGLNGVILDLRFNGGGYLNAAADVVDLFVSEGVIVKSNPRHGLATYEIAHRSGTHPDYPLVVLINGSSASASEIVSGALQDPKYKRATLVGHRTYGKGSVQMVIPNGGGSQLKYTVAYYHLPSNQPVKNRYQMVKLGRKDWGIAPDDEVDLTSEETQKMIDIQRDNDVLFRTDHKQNDGESKRHTLQETLKADPQLAIGLLVVQSKLADKGDIVSPSPIVFDDNKDNETSATAK